MAPQLLLAQFQSNETLSPGAQPLPLTVTVVPCVPLVGETDSAGVTTTNETAANRPVLLPLTPTEYVPAVAVLGMVMMVEKAPLLVATVASVVPVQLALAQAHLTVTLSLPPKPLPLTVAVEPGVPTGGLMPAEMTAKVALANRPVVPPIAPIE